MRRFVIIILIAIGIARAGYAACVADGGNWTTTPDYASVASCVAGADAGDTVTVTAGDGTETWASALTITSGINLVGPGKANLTITHGAAAGSTLITYTPADFSLNTPFEVSGFTFDLNNNGHGIALNANVAGSYTTIQTKIKIYDNEFKNSTVSPLRRAIVNDGMRGVIYNNIFTNIYYPIRHEAGIGTEWWNNWDGIVYGGEDNNIYIEDNIFNGTKGTIMDCQDGNRYVFRYNRVEHTNSDFFPMLDMHGNAGQLYSCFGGEVYGNYFTTGTGYGQLLDIRGGKAVVFYNNFEGTPSGGQIYAGKAREEYDDALNPTTNVQPQHVSDTYFWANRRNYTTAVSAAYEVAGGDCCDAIAENSEFFNYESSFNGTAGVGCGTLGKRPATCTMGVGYWATDQANCSDLTGYVGANATEIVGKLYKCTATDTWTEYYTPYTYPHPLRDEESTPTLTVTVTNTGAGHSPSHDGARSVQTGGSLTFTSGVYNGWKVTIGGTCGCTTDGCTVTPTEDCTIECTSSAIQLMPW